MHQKAPTSTNDFDTTLFRFNTSETKSPILPDSRKTKLETNLSFEIFSF